MRAPSAARCVYKLVEFDGNPRIKLSQEIRKACHPPPSYRSPYRTPYRSLNLGAANALPIPLPRPPLLLRPLTRPRLSR